MGKHFSVADKSLYDTIKSLEDVPVNVDGRQFNVKEHPILLETIAKLGPAHFLVFATGADRKPGSGWKNKPQITLRSLLRATTCAVCVTIPVNIYAEDLQAFMLVFANSMVHGATFNDI